MYEFGVMELYETGKHEFVFKNTGEAPLVLQKGSTTCKCTLSQLEDCSIQPGEERVVTFGMDA